jgi:hypothetical protein
MLLDWSNHITMRGMKRPQFSFRLLLMIVALVAVVVAWRRAVWINSAPDRNLEIIRKESELRIIEQLNPNSDLHELRDELESLKRSSESFPRTHAG